MKENSYLFNFIIMDICRLGYSILLYCNNIFGRIYDMIVHKSARNVVSANKNILSFVHISYYIHYKRDTHPSSMYQSI